MLGIQLGSLCALSFGHPQNPLASLLAPTQSRRTRCNALRDHTPRGNDPFDRFTESFPRSAVPNQGREGFEILLERVRPTALPFHFPSPFCSLLPRFYHSLPLYEWMSVFQDSTTAPLASLVVLSGFISWTTLTASLVLRCLRGARKRSFRSGRLLDSVGRII